jgi:hypothetical protein
MNRAGIDSYTGAVDFFRTEHGRTLRIEELEDGGLRVEILKEGIWIAAPLGMIGLRLSKSTRRLSRREVLALPS